MMQKVAKRFGYGLLICIGLLCAGEDSIAQKETKDFSYYDVIGRRDLFKPPMTEIKKKPTSEAKTETNEYADPKQIRELRNLIITGIVCLGDHYKVILEEGGKNYYLGVGDEVKGAEILKVEEEKVVLAYGGKEVELLFERKPRERGPGYRSPSPVSRPTRTRRTRRTPTEPGIPPIPPGSR